MSDIISPGIHPLSIEDYHDACGISKSGLDLISISPAHYAHRYLVDAPHESTPSMQFGVALHTAVLEPQRFKETYVVADVRRKTKAWKELLDQNPGKRVLKLEEAIKIDKMARAIGRHKLARILLTDGAPEQSMFWRDPETGVLCKIRPDWRRANGTIVDLKTAGSASMSAFSRAVATYRYHVQAAFYLDGAKAVTGVGDNFCFIVVEKTPPHAVAVYMTSRDTSMVEVGRKLYQDEVKLYADCLATDSWPGYPETVQNIELPPWATNNYR